ncbi:hypothetical protein RRSWK_01643 [Rhodopirellula sp. SWK7]|nr:hypothetical protein RRSWK_01643 [Rhodopirellula sp. SWK7]
MDGAIVESIFNNLPFAESDMTALNPSQSLRVLRDAVRETGYPIA